MVFSLLASAGPGINGFFGKTGHVTAAGRKRKFLSLQQAFLYNASMGKTFLSLALTGAAVLAGAQAPAGNAEETGAALHRRLLVFDAHAHGVLPGAGGGTAGEQASLENLRRGGVDAVVLPLPLGEAGGDPAAGVLADAATVRGLLSRSEAAGLALGAADVRALHRQGRIAVMLGLESFDGPLGGDTAVLARFHRAGIRVITLAEGGRDRLSDFDPKNPEVGPLSDFGRRVVREMNRLGLLIDVSHLSDREQRAVVALSSAPVIASHSNCRSLVPTPRNLPDDVVAALAEKGGALMLDCDSATLTGRAGRAPMAALVAHLEHVRGKAGAAHAGIGSDFGGSGSTGPMGLETAAGWPNLTAALLARGWSPEEIAGVMGENLLRILDAAARSR